MLKGTEILFINLYTFNSPKFALKVFQNRKKNPQIFFWIIAKKNTFMDINTLKVFKKLSRILWLYQKDYIRKYGPIHSFNKKHMTNTLFKVLFTKALLIIRCHIPIINITTSLRPLFSPLYSNVCCTLSSLRFHSLNLQLRKKKKQKKKKKKHKQLKLKQVIIYVQTISSP